MKRVLSLVLALVMCLSLCACGGESSVGSTTPAYDKGSIKNPYSVGDSFEITAYDVVPWTAYTPEGRQVENPIKFEISNIKLLEQQSYSSYKDGKSVSHNNYYLVSFDLEVLDSSITDTITFNLDYLSIHNLNSNGQSGNLILGDQGKIPNDCIYFDWQTLMPLEGAKWNFADVIHTENEKELSYIVFHYCGEDGEFHDVYVSVEEQLKELVDSVSPTETPVENISNENSSPKEATIDDIMKNAELQYPASNDLFKYNVYDTYVEITEYIGENTANEVVVPAMLENLPVYKVGKQAFADCEVKSIVFEDGIYEISSEFTTYALERVTLPSTLHKIDDWSFERCSKLKEVIIPEGVGGISSRAFQHCSSLKEITIPSSVTTLHPEAFAFCTSLETVNLPEGMTTIWDGVFKGCTSLKTLTLPTTLHSLGESAFASSGLENIELPETVKEVGENLFLGCKSLSAVKVYNSDLEIRVEKYGGLFSQCNPALIVHGKAGSTIAKQCAEENIFFEVIK